MGDRLAGGPGDRADHGRKRHGVLTIGITYAIIGLSLTLLTGYGGEINLAPVSFGAIATIIVFHVGLSGTGSAQRITFWGPCSESW